jgi:signal transduction histidine kinase
MSVALSDEQLDSLFPSRICVTPQFRVISTGPSLRRRAPWIAPGDEVLAHFTAGTPFSIEELSELADSGRIVTLVCVRGGFILSGRVIGQSEGFLLALHYTLSKDWAVADYMIADFTPGDPRISSTLIINIQKAMIEESLQVASELEAERQRVSDVVERAGRMAGYVAHDFNNYLSIIALNARRLLRGDVLDDRQARCVSVILETTERSSDLTRGMMTLTSQKNDSQIAFPVDEALQESAAMFRSVCGSSIAFRFSAGVPDVRAGASRSGLVACVVNLLVNARQAMPDGGSIKLETGLAGRDDLDPAKARPETEYIVVSVSDEGAGMPPEVVDRAFDLFFSTKQYGSGMGLASVRDYSEQMDGWTTIATEPGAGTTVRLFLPMVSAPAARTAASKAATSDRPRVLVVDDEELALEALSELLEDEGFAVTTAISGEDARRCLRADAYDVLLTDVIMQGKDGIELAAWATRRQAHLAVILMSGFVPDSNALRPEWRFIRKPLDPDNLCRMIASAVD